MKDTKHTILQVDKFWIKRDRTENLSAEVYVKHLRENLQILSCNRHVLYFTLVAEDSATVKKAVAKKSHNVYYDARLLTSNYDSQQKPKKVYCYISPKVNAAPVLFSFLCFRGIFSNWKCME